MKIFVIYDISNDKTRTSTANALKNYGFQRVGYSSFYGELDKKTYSTMANELKKEMDEEKIHIIRLCGACYRKIELIGKAELLEYSDNEIL